MKFCDYFYTVSRLAGVIGLAVSFLFPPAVAFAKEQPVVVFAAASLKNALDDVTKAWTRSSGHTATISFAGSSTLAQQIAQGAPADIYFSANLGWMNYLDQRHLIKAGTRTSLLGNSLVLIATRDLKGHVTLKPGIDLLSLLGNSRLAMCDPAVPAGAYGKAALKSLGIWDALKDKTAMAENVRAALALVARGEAPLGIVYKTDAVADRKDVKVLDTFPADSHPAIIYPVAITASSNTPLAANLLAFMASPAAKPLFEKQGFTLIPQTAKH